MAKYLFTPDKHRIKDLTGQQFGYLTAIRPVRQGRKGQVYWLFRCDYNGCGTEKVILGKSVTRKTEPYVSCGCYLKSGVSGEKKRTHGKSKTPVYKTWLSMIDRCHRVNHKAFPLYGAKGIHVCESWRSSFQNFLADMGERPSSKHSIDRIDGTKGYFKENCRWATDQEQCWNRKTTRFYTYQGQTLPIAEWARKFKVKRPTLYWRLSHGRKFEDAIKSA